MWWLAPILGLAATCWRRNCQGGQLNTIANIRTSGRCGGRQCNVLLIVELGHETTPVKLSGGFLGVLLLLGGRAS